MCVKNILKDNRFIILDGAMGTMLQLAGLKLGERPEILNITNTDSITEVHLKYLNSGSDIIYTNTFGANSHKLEGTGYGVDEVVAAGVKAAKNAVRLSGKKAYVALDVGPIGELLEPNGTLSFDKAYSIFREQVLAGVENGCDVIVIETMTDLYEMKAAVLAVKENCDLPVFCTMTFEENARTFTGCSIESFFSTAEGLGVDALGLNCSLGPDKIYPMAKKLIENTDIPVIVKANAGLPNLNTGKYDLTAPMYLEQIKSIADLGVKIIGGCCGTDPEYIRLISEYLSDKELGNRKNLKRSVFSTPTRYVDVDDIKIVGDSIGPESGKRFINALNEKDMDYVLSQAINQVDAGADILDINVGVPGVDEKETIVDVIKSIQDVVDTPLQISTSDYEALEAGLRYYNGKPLVNAVTGEEKSMKNVLPLVKKYGAAVVIYPADEKGIPEKAEDRLIIAEKVMKRAEKLGIKKQDIYVDGITLAASANQKSAMETLKMTELVKKELGVKTLLDIKAISYGLPNRDALNCAFMTAAMDRGLDLAMADPASRQIMGAAYSYRVLKNTDMDSERYIEKYKDFDETVSSDRKVSEDAEEGKESDLKTAIEISISKGLRDDTRALSEKILEEMDEIELINEVLIPALDKVGERYDNGEIFLPQLIKSATASQEAFEVIREKAAKSDSDTVYKGKIAMATVKGDIHDIGKNIVKVILENYGYQVIDLGRDVDSEKIRDTVVEENIQLVGLSALMTTTLKSMEEAIEMIKEVSPQTKIMVGGAVLTEDYAERIGADYCCKDAKKSLEAAKAIFGGQDMK